MLNQTLMLVSLYNDTIPRVKFGVAVLMFMANVIKEDIICDMDGRNKFIISTIVFEELGLLNCYVSKLIFLNL
jgi:hypothetical protein